MRNGMSGKLTYLIGLTEAIAVYRFFFFGENG